MQAIHNYLFLDRDGVINQRLPGQYVTDWEQFVFLPGVLEALKILSPLFSRVLVVTNQLGVEKKLMNNYSLDEIHQRMMAEVERAGGKIDKVYACTDRSACRKPQTGMGVQAKKDFPEIDFKRSWMVGDSITDMQFGQALGMKTILIPTKEEEQAAYDTIRVDHRFDGLAMLARFAHLL